MAALPKRRATVWSRPCERQMTHMSDDRVAVALGWFGLGVLVYLVYLVVQPFLTPLGWAAVLAIVFHPVHERLEARWGTGRSAAATTVAATVLVVGPMILILTAFAREAAQAAGNFQRALAAGQFAWIESTWQTVERYLQVTQQVDLAAMAGDWARQSALFLVSRSGSILQNIAAFLFELVVALFATFFLLRDSRSIMAAVRRMLPLDDEARERLITQTRELVSMSVISSGIVAVVQGLLGGLVFAAVGIDGAVFWGVVMAVFCLLPLGAWVVWLPAAILLAIGGSVGRALIVAALGFGIVSAIDNVLRPALLSGRARINGLLILMALLGGIRVFGPLGLVLGPILLATALALVRTYLGMTEQS